MFFTETPIKGAFIVDLEPKVDERGFFARSFCVHEFEQHGLNPRIMQANRSFNYKQGTVRGMHYQVVPASATKFIRCVSGAVWDVIIDMRPDSPTFHQHFGLELSAENHRGIYVPDMCAHGFQALTDGAELFYFVGDVYAPEYERGVRYNDPVIGIEWPLPVFMINERDANWPLVESADPILKERLKQVTT